MRVLLVINGLERGGAERVVECLAEDLKAHQDAVAVVATTRDGPIGARLRQRDIPVTVLGMRGVKDALTVARLSNLMRRFRPDVVHSHLEVADAIAWAASVPFCRLRRVSTVHNVGRGALRRHFAGRMAWQFVLCRFDAVSAVSHAVLQHLPFLPQARVVPPSVVRLSDPPLDREKARQALGVDSDTKLVLAVGRLTKVKGFDVLAQAAAQLRTPDVKVMVIGEGPEREALFQSSHLGLLGEKAQAERFLSAADILVNASRSEGFPQILLQALAAEVPVVATRVGGTSEIIRHEECGLLVPPDDADTLAAAIDRLLSDKATAQKMARAGRTHLVVQDFTREAMFRQTRMLYEEALSLPRRPTGSALKRHRSLRGHG